MNIYTVANENPVEITSVQVDKNLPQEGRLAEYIRQIKNPFFFKCGKYTIQAEYDKDGPPLEECLLSLLTV